jgi:predicted nucleic acid-binding Zn ribbon protein
VSRRRAPRPLSSALARVTAGLAPATAIARVQGCWVDAVGDIVAAEAQPVSERDGTVTVACRSAVWAQELALLAPDLLEKLNAALADRPITELRFKVGDVRTVS